MNDTPMPETGDTAPPKKYDVSPEMVEQFTQQEIETMAFEYSRSGPLPSPEEMEQYKQVDPRLLEVITEIALTGSRYPESRDRQLAKTASKMINALTLLGIGILVLAAYLAYLGFDVAAIIAAVTPFGTWLISTTPALFRRLTRHQKDRTG